MHRPRFLLSGTPFILFVAAACIATAACASSTDHPMSESADASTDTEAAASCDPGFATSVVSVTYGAGAGFGQPSMPTAVLGPPKGAGNAKGGTDVVSLGTGGVIVLGFGGEGIRDGAGPDFAVFENAFFAGGDPSKPFIEPAEVSVSEDGQNWMEFPCQSDASPYEGCAGIRPVLSNPDNGISPFDPQQAGGDWFDLAWVGMSQARYVRIRDRSTAGAAGSAGFDLDAVVVRNPACAP